MDEHTDAGEQPPHALGFSLDPAGLALRLGLARVLGDGHPGREGADHRLAGPDARRVDAVLDRARRPDGRGPLAAPRRRGREGRRRSGPDRRPVVVHFRRDTLQHDLTIGEPPQDMGSLFEIAGGVAVLVGAVAAAVPYARGRAWAGAPNSGRPRHPGGGAVRRDGVVVHPPHRPEPVRRPGAHVRQSRLQRVPLGQEAMSVEERQR